MKIVVLAFASIVISAAASAQQGYEFEVYGPGIPAIGQGELELHTNFVPSGSQLFDAVDGRATHRAFRSSLELSTGLTNWLAASLYVTSYARNGAGLEYVGNRARITAIAPAKWNLPFDAGLAHEVSYARAGFAEHKWTYELTPIIAKTIGAISLIVNPALERGLGSGEQEWELEPRGRLEYAFGEDEGVGLEYYAILGPVSAFDARSQQLHQLFFTGKGELPGGIEAGVGVGRGLTSSTDRWVITTRLEMKF